MQGIAPVLAVILVAGCTASPTPSPTGATPGRPAPRRVQGPADAQLPDAPPVAKPTTAVDSPPPAIPAPVGELLEDRWRCERDEDCRQTCGLGAVSAAWLAAHPDADDCDDGCGWKTGQQACRDSECVTLEGDGKTIDASCTRLTKPLHEP